jgi:hypothetical protein
MRFFYIFSDRNSNFDRCENQAGICVVTLSLRLAFHNGIFINPRNMKKGQITWVFTLTLLGLLLFLVTSCKKKDDSSNTSSSLAIGQVYQGGIIAYILQPGDNGYDKNVPHGLIAAPSDQSGGGPWNNGSFTTTGAFSKSLGKGYDNTVLIVATQGPGNYAAKLCYDLVLGGYSDWFLPSLDELGILRQNRDLIGGFNDYNYWSSTEYDDGSAWDMTFMDGGWQYGPKDLFQSVRAVREF